MSFKMYLKSQNLFGFPKSRQNRRGPQEDLLFPSSSISNLSQELLQFFSKKDSLEGN